MALKLDIAEKTGAYLGTEINEKWYRRYTKDKFLARGNGKYWYDGDAFFFRRFLSKTPVQIPLADIIGFKIGKWHSGRWCIGCPILKIIWSKNGQKLSSGFLISKNESDLENVISKLKANQ